jgi:hypothetical protein
VIRRPIALGLTRPLVDKPSEPVRIDDLNRAIPSPDQAAALEGFQQGIDLASPEMRELPYVPLRSRRNCHADSIVLDKHRQHCCERVLPDRFA